MSDEIRAGDVVVCVSTFIDSPPYAPQVSKLYRVTSVEDGFDTQGEKGTFLILSGVWDGWWKERFRKLPPASEEFTQQMRACRPVHKEPA